MHPPKTMPRRHGLDQSENSKPRWAWGSGDSIPQKLGNCNSVLYGRSPRRWPSSGSNINFCIERWHMVGGCGSKNRGNTPSARTALSSRKHWSTYSGNALPHNGCGRKWQDIMNESWGNKCQTRHPKIAYCLSWPRAPTPGDGTT